MVGKMKKYSGDQKDVFRLMLLLLESYIFKRRERYEKKNVGYNTSKRLEMQGR